MGGCFRASLVGRVKRVRRPKRIAGVAACGCAGVVAGIVQQVKGSMQRRRTGEGVAAGSMGELINWCAMRVAASIAVNPNARSMEDAIGRVSLSEFGGGVSSESIDAGGRSAGDGKVGAEMTVYGLVASAGCLDFKKVNDMMCERSMLPPETCVWCDEREEGGEYPAYQFPVLTHS